MSPWLATSPDGIRLRVKVTPGSARGAVVGVATDAAGEAHLAVRVQAPPDGGRANAEALKLLSRTAGVPVSRLTLIQGQRGRRKVVHLDDTSSEVVARLRELEREHQA